MQKKSLTLLAGALAGAVAMTAVPTASFAASHASEAKPRGEMGERQMGKRRQRGAILGLVCSENGSERLTKMFENMSTRLTLTDNQQTLFDTFQVNAMAAHSNFLDNCEPRPERTAESADSVPNPGENLSMRAANIRAMADALDIVVPSAEAFFESLTDEQLQELRPERSERGGQKHRHGHRHNHSHSHNDG